MRKYRNFRKQSPVNVSFETIQNSEHPQFPPILSAHNQNPTKQKRKTRYELIESKQQEKLTLPYVSDKNSFLSKNQKSVKLKYIGETIKMRSNPTDAS